MKKLLHPLTRLLLAVGLSAFSVVAFAQKTAVNGIVTDAEGAPLVGATVIIMQNARPEGGGTTTNTEGKFTVNASQGQQLAVSYIGYREATVEVTSKTFYEIALQSDSEQIDDVVVVGYGTQKKVNVTGSVSTIDASTFEKRPVVSASVALQGMAPGVTVTTPSGAPGADGGAIRIRGINSFGGSSTAPLVLIDGIEGSLDSVDPVLIESISILKDAASSSIYGSRAANGVILVTTKRSSTERFTVTYKGTVGWQSPTDLPETVNALEYRELTNAMNLQDGNAPTYDDESMALYRKNMGKDPDLYPNTDWQDHIYRNPSVVQNHNLSAIGGTKTVRYNLSLGYVKNPGIVYNTDYERYQLRSNVEVDIKPWITAGMNIFGYMDSNNPNAENATNGGDVIFGSGALNTVPGMTLYDPETGLYGGVQNPEEENVSNFNPYRRMWFYKEDFPIKTRRIVPKLFARLSPVEGLTLSASFTYNSWERNEEYQLCDKNLYRFTLDGPVLLREGTVRTYINRYNRRNTFRTSDVTARYEWNVSKLNASALVGISQEYNKREDERFRKYDLADDALTSINGGSTNGEIEGNYTEWAMRSYFGRINLSWDDKYLLEVNLRADGSSRFAPDKRWGWFPSVSAGWSISEEPFLKKAAGWLDMLKLRVSYGTLGNNATSTFYMYQPLYASANYVLGNAVASGLAQTTLANPNLTWETTHMTNIGLDYGLFAHRLSGSVDVFNRLTTDILISLPAPLEHGTSAVPNQNAGKVRNRGIDFDISWFDHIGSMTYSLGFHMGYVRNKVTKFQGEVPSINGVYKLQEGKPINQLYVMSVDRIVRDQSDLDYVQSLVDKNPDYFATYQRPELGDFLYADADHDGNLDANDRIEIGNGNSPSFTFGGNIGISWKGFDFSMLLQGVGKHKVYYNNQAFRFVTVMGQSLNKDITDHAWTPENPYNSKYPRLRNNANSKNNIASDALVFNASYLRCKNIQLGYTLPRHISEKFFVENLKIYTSIDNLFTLTDFPGLDPEIAAGVGYPQLRQYSVGINVTF